MKYLYIRCQFCNRLYPVVYSKSRMVLLGRIDLSVCDNCNRPRNKNMFESSLDDWHCQSCTVPEPYVERKTKQLCVTCYNNFIWGKRVEKRNNLILLKDEHDKNKHSCE